MKVFSTIDVSLDSLRELRAELVPDLELDVEEGQVVFMSAQPPSWVALVEHADLWLKVFGGLYLAELVKEAAKETWKNRAKIATAAGNQVRKLADGIANLRHRLAGRTRIEIGFPTSDEVYSTRLEMEGSDPADLAIQIALFVHYLPAVCAVIKSEGLDRGNAVRGIRLTVGADASLEMRWLDNKTLAEASPLFSPIS
jgi:hypothetical protein